MIARDRGRYPAPPEFALGQPPPGSDRAAAGCGDARRRGGERLQRHRHVMRVCVQQRVGGGQHADMAAPEDQVAALGRFVGRERAPEQGRLHVGIARGGGPGGHQRELDQRRAVEPAPAAPAPEVGRPEETRRRVDEVARDRREVLDRDEAAAAQRREAAGLARDVEIGEEGQLGRDARLELRRGVAVAGARRDAAAGAAVRAEAGGRDVADVAVALGLAPGASVGRGLVDGEPLAAEQLRREAGGGIARRGQVEQAGGDAARDALDEARGLDAAAQPGGGEVGARRGQPGAERGQVVEQNRPSSSASRARAPWKAPPLGRPGLATGVQP